MKIKTVFGYAICVMTLFSSSAPARSIPAIISAEWLAQNIDNSKLVVIDIRNEALFNESHIPGAARAPFSSWIVRNGQLLLELPPDKAICDLLGNLGITKESIIVVVNKTDTDWDRADATRVAWTCIAAGIRNTSVLDGGYNRWLHLGKPTTKEIVARTPTQYNGAIDRSTLTTKAEVLEKIGQSIILDARTPEDYFGVANDGGHIRSALNLPAPWAFAVSGSFRDDSVLKAMAAGVIGEKTGTDINIYCGVGGFASTWWFILSEVLGYADVKIYDGSFQEWSADPNAPVTSFSWK